MGQSRIYGFGRLNTELRRAESAYLKVSDIVRCWTILFTIRQRLGNHRRARPPRRVPRPRTATALGLARIRGHARIGPRWARGPIAFLALTNNV